MQFYVPTIGDKIYLKKPWTFTLHREGRNETLASRLTEVTKEVTHNARHWYRAYKAKRTTVPWPLPSKDKKIYIAKDDKLTEKEQAADWFIGREYATESTPGAFSETYTWKSIEWKQNEAQVTLPAGTELKIDRIYIRKGNGNFDSITYWIDGCPDPAFAPSKGKKGGVGHRGKVRFWVKLKDANRINCSLEPVHDTDAPVASRFERVEVE